VSDQTDEQPEQMPLTDAPALERVGWLGDNGKFYKVGPEDDSIELTPVWVVVNIGPK
jgi:hypothetical protein